MAIKQNFPNINPVLNTKFTTGVIDPRFTFSRADLESNASYYDQSGILKYAAIGYPRVSYDPFTTEAKGVIIEGASTNLLTYSEDLTQSAWIKSGATISANATTAPDGTTADKIVEDTSTNSHSVANIYGAMVAGTVYTLSAYVKPAGRNFVRLSVASIASTSITVNLTTKEVQGATSGVLNYNVEKVWNSWLRVSLTFRPSISGNAACTAWIVKEFQVGSYQGDGTSGIYVWGMQLESSSSATSYIRTSNIQKTREQDLNFGAALGVQGKGTVIIEAAAKTGQTLFSSGTAAIIAPDDNLHKIALTYDSTGSMQSIDGATVTSLAATTAASSFSLLPSATGYIKRIAIYPRKVTALQLQSMSAV